MLWKIVTFFGVLCLLYYVLMCALIKRWNSTFSRFWIAAGICLLTLGRVRPGAAVYPIFVFSAVFIAAECRILIGMIPCRKKNLPYLIVLGAQVRGKSLSSSLYRRIERARQYLLENSETVVIVSGGRGKGEDITEAMAMYNYLTEQGIEEERIYMESRSTTTEENLKLSSEYVSDLSLPVGIVTNNFHMYRACCYAKKLGYKSPQAVPAGCPPVFLVNYMVREFFALIKMLLIPSPIWRLTKKKRML